jgi:hypothetical protein
MDDKPHSIVYHMLGKKNIIGDYLPYDCAYIFEK